MASRVSNIERVQRRFSLAIATLVVLLICHLAVVGYLIATVDNGIHVVALAGQQSRLVAQIGQFSAQVNLRDGIGNPQLTRRLLVQASDQLERVSRGLIHGDPALELHGTRSTVIRAVYNGDGSWPLKDGLRRYLRAARAIGSVPPQGLSPDNPDYLHVRTVGSTLQDRLDVITQEFAHDTRRQLKIIWWSSCALFAALIATLVVAWLYAYMPARKEVRALAREAHRHRHA